MTDGETPAVGNDNALPRDEHNISINEKQETATVGGENGDNFVEDNSSDDEKNSSDDENFTRPILMGQLLNRVSDGEDLFNGLTLAEREEIFGGEPINIPNFANKIRNGDFKNMIIMCGAGISVSAGIPDFRSRGGLYAQFREKYKIDQPERVFDIDFFRHEPGLFTESAKEMCPGKYKPTLTHYFFKLLTLKGLVRRIYSQNIDTLEKQAGLEDDIMVYAHGSFADCHCIDCGRQMKLTKWKSGAGKSREQSFLDPMFKFVDAALSDMEKTHPDPAYFMKAFLNERSIEKARSFIMNVQQTIIAAEARKEEIDQTHSGKRNLRTTTILPSDEQNVRASLVQYDLEHFGPEMRFLGSSVFAHGDGHHGNGLTSGVVMKRLLELEQRSASGSSEMSSDLIPFDIMDFDFSQPGVRGYDFTFLLHSIEALFTPLDLWDSDPFNINSSSKDKESTKLPGMSELVFNVANAKRVENISSTDTFTTPGANDLLVDKAWDEVESAFDLFVNSREVFTDDIASKTPKPFGVSDVRRVFSIDEDAVVRYLEAYLINDQKIENVTTEKYDEKSGASTLLQQSLERHGLTDVKRLIPLITRYFWPLFEIFRGVLGAITGKVKTSPLFYSMHWRRGYEQKAGDFSEFKNGAVEENEEASGDNTGQETRCFMCNVVCGC